MSVQENLKMGAYRRRGSLTADMERVYSLFPVLKERRGQDGGTLSGGEQQMLAIGRALMGNPRLLLLDEPSMGLAPLVVAKIFTILEQINEQGTTVLVVEQNAAQALRLASRGYVLETGVVALADRADALLADDRVRSAYLGEDVA
jgi:branched-chain amino acid transport system ATP-binding protein